MSQFRKNQRILPKHVIGPFVIMMLTVIALAITQTFADSPEWFVATFLVPDSDENNANSISEEIVTSVKIGSCISRTFIAASDSTKRGEAVSSSDSTYTLIDIASSVVIVLSLVVMVYMAWLTRQIPEEISDSRQVFKAVLTGLFLEFVMSILVYIGIYFQIHGLAVLARSLNYFFAATVYVGFLIMPKLYSIWQKQRKSNQPSPVESDAKFSNFSTDRTILDANGKRERVYISGLNEASQVSS